MEKTVREAVNLLRVSFKMQRLDAQAEMPDRALMSMLNNTSLLFIKQTTDNRKLWNSPNIFQTIPCLNLKSVPLADCGFYTSSCNIARSLYKLPRIAEGTNWGMLIKGVYSIDGISRTFIESSSDRYANSLGLQQRTNKIHFWIQDNYLYITDENIQAVKITAFFEEDISEQLQYFPDYCGNALAKGCCSGSDEVSINDMNKCCPQNPLDLEFKCPGYMLNDVIKSITQTYLGVYEKVNESTTTGVPQLKK